MIVCVEHKCTAFHVVSRTHIHQLFVLSNPIIKSQGKCSCIVIRVCRREHIISFFLGNVGIGFSIQPPCGAMRIVISGRI